jgi:hypothetical protein
LICKSKSPGSCSFPFFQGPPGQGGGAAIDHLKKDPELKPLLLSFSVAGFSFQSLISPGVLIRPAPMLPNRKLSPAPMANVLPAGVKAIEFTCIV